MHRMARALLLLPLLIGCGIDGGSTLVRHGHCGSLDGVISLSWTLQGQVPSATSCQGIDHLSIDINDGTCGATISPVPCALDKWLYQNLPVGNTTVTIEALDRGGITVAGATQVVPLSSTIPDFPTPIDLR